MLGSVLLMLGLFPLRCEDTSRELGGFIEGVIHVTLVVHSMCSRYWVL